LDLGVEATVTTQFIGREIHMPKLFDRNAPETWLKEGKGHGCGGERAGKENPQRTLCSTSASGDSEENWRDCERRGERTG